MFQSPGDVAFNIFGLPVYYYGIIMACSIFIGVYVSYFLYKNFYDALSAEKIFDFAPLLILIGIAGARVYYCTVNSSYYLQYPLEVFNIRQGGLSVHGMIIAGIIALYFCSKLYKMPFLKLADVFLCASALSQSIGRWGNFFNSEAFGFPTTVPWKLFIPLSKRPIEYINSEFFHPAFLYESILDLLLFIILFFVLKRYSNRPGITTCLYLILYSIIRIFVEHIRIDSAMYVFGIPVAQVMSFFMIFGALIMLFRLVYKKF